MLGVGVSHAENDEEGEEGAKFIGDGNGAAADFSRVHAHNITKIQ